ncbi:MAG: hypothetical protein FWC46_07850 [Actinomycetia bacterium]|nr:hypothetical protein [Actinomycetes bacterium]
MIVTGVEAAWAVTRPGPNVTTPMATMMATNRLSSEDRNVRCVRVFIGVYSGLGSPGQERAAVMMSVPIGM